MKCRSVAISCLVFLFSGVVLVVSVPQPSSATSRVILTQKNKSLRKFNLKGACRLRVNSKDQVKGIYGIIRRKKFVAANSFMKLMLASQALQEAVNRGKKNCNRTARRYLKNPEQVISAPGTTGASGAKTPASVPTRQIAASCKDQTFINSAPYNQWKSNMIVYGRQICDLIKSGRGSFDQKLGNTYYDAEYVFYQIADFTGDNSWLECAQASEAIYRDTYVLPNSGRTPGRWNFTEGLAADYMRNHDPASLEAIRLITTNAEFSSDNISVLRSNVPDWSREVAHTLISLLQADTVGLGWRQRATDIANQLLGFFDSWFVDRDSTYVRPFMIGITSAALTQYADKRNDPRVLARLQKMLPQMWSELWDPNARAFHYSDVETTSDGVKPAPDLNLLIAPAYAWVYQKTGDKNFITMGDQIFAGGVDGAYLSNAKQFNQSYRWSFNYVRWRCR